jgi:hypothetical protein
MPDPDATAGIASWVQAGGVVAFAAAVWWELKLQRRERSDRDKEHTTILTSIKETLSALLERERSRETGPIRRLPTEDR